MIRTDPETNALTSLARRIEEDSLSVLRGIGLARWEDLESWSVVSDETGCPVITVGAGGKCRVSLDAGQTWKTL